MPYIKQGIRNEIESTMRSPATAGELNYMITNLCMQYLEAKDESYQSYNDILGALEGCKLELYRRKIAAYEDLKIKENGDVY